MKTNLIFLLLTPLVLTACASSQHAPIEEDAGRQLQTQETAADKGITAPDKGEAAISSETLPGVTSNLLQHTQKDSVYFDFDSFNIKPEYMKVIQQQAGLLNANHGSVTLEGNSDERGSAEYNLALGDKRAYTVRKSLELLGVKGTRIDVVSFGEEKPRSSCHEEKCWSENRRVDFNRK